MRAAAAVSLLLLFAACLVPAASAGFGMPDALTSRGKVVEDLYDIIAVLGIGMFLIVFGWLVAVIVRFREGTGHGKATHERERHSLKAEMAWTLIPLALVLWIGYAAYGGLVALDHGIPLDEAEMEIKVEGTQWNWQFDYGQGVRLLANPDLHTGQVPEGNTFLVPQDTNLLFNITSADVIHAFQVVDANRAYVMFNDANPLGANKHNLQTANLPRGDYLVQCNKYCLNPGHAYMHAAIRAVPRPVFDHWLAGKAASAGASLVQNIPLQVVNGLPVDATGTGLANQTLAVTTRLVLDVGGSHGDVTLNVGDQERFIPAGEATDTFAAFDFPAAGNFTLRVTEQSGNRTTVSDVGITVVPATVVRIDMKNFLFEPGELRFEVGKTYLIQAFNAGESTHDVNFGRYTGGADSEIIANSALAGPGGTTSFLFAPKEAGTWDMWCSPHASIGMLGYNVVVVA